MKKLLKYAAAATLLISGMVSACEFDTDCSPGSKCVKKKYQLEGVCAGGISPGNSNDSRPYNPEPYTKPRFKTESEGDTCSFSTDCSVGESCIKSSGSISGVCMKKGY